MQGEFFVLALNVCFTLPNLSLPRHFDNMLVDRWPIVFGNFINLPQLLFVGYEPPVKSFYYTFAQLKSDLFTRVEVLFTTNSGKKKHQQFLSSTDSYRPSPFRYFRFSFPDRKVCQLIVSGLIVMYYLCRIALTCRLVSVQFSS